jgi:hypothetical protein
MIFYSVPAAVIARLDRAIHGAACANPTLDSPDKPANDKKKK